MTILLNWRKLTKVKYKWPRNIRNCNFSVVSSVNKKVGRYFRIIKKIRKHKKMSKKWTLPKEYVTRGKLQFLKRLWGAPEGARVHSLEQFHYLLYTSVLTHTHSSYLFLVFLVDQTALQLLAAAATSKKLIVQLFLLLIWTSVTRTYIFLVAKCEPKVLSCFENIYITKKFENYNH